VRSTRLPRSHYERSYEVAARSISVAAAILLFDAYKLPIYSEFHLKFEVYIVAGYQLAELEAEQMALCVLVKTKEPKIEYNKCQLP
jgi:hypothetical protein